MVRLAGTCLLFAIVTSFPLCFDAISYQNAGSRLILDYNWPNMIESPKRFPHVKSCFHFYVTLSDDTHAIKKCPEGQAFDFPTLRCANVRRAKCWSARFVMERFQVNQFICPFLWGPYPNPGDCSKFYSCQNGIARLRMCPTSFLFDKTMRKCIAKDNALCADDSDEIDPGYNCPYKWGFFTFPRDCSKYYECLDRKPSVRSCRRNMLFDNRLRRCLPSSRVRCGARRNPYGEFEKSTSIESETNAFSTVGSTNKATVIPTIQVIRRIDDLTKNLTTF